MTANGNRFYLRDDVDTLICKLENAVDAYYLENEPCDIDQIESDIETLTAAVENGDTATMQSIFNNYAHWFKRYR